LGNKLAAISFVQGEKSAVIFNYFEQYVF